MESWEEEERNHASGSERMFVCLHIDTTILMEAAALALHHTLPRMDGCRSYRRRGRLAAETCVGLWAGGWDDEAGPRRPAIENANDAGCWTSPSVADSQHCICIALAAASKVDRSLASRCMVITTHTPSYIQAFTAAAKPSPSLSLYSLAAGVRSGQLW